MFGHFYQCLKGARVSAICKKWVVQILKWDACAARRMQRNQEDRYAGQWYVLSADVFEFTIIIPSRGLGAQTMALWGCACMDTEAGSGPEEGELAALLENEALRENVAPPP